jgi:hypothetical protein
MVSVSLIMLTFWLVIRGFLILGTGLWDFGIGVAEVTSMNTKLLNKN